MPRNAPQARKGPPIARWNDYPAAGRDTLLSAAAAALSLQNAQIDSLDNKLQTVMGAAAALVPILIAIVALDTKQVQSGVLVGIEVAGGVTALLAIIVALIAFFPRDWRHGPLISALAEKARADDANDDRIAWRAANNYYRAYQINARLAVDKAEAVKRAYIAVGVEFLLFVAGLGVIIAT